MLKLFLKNEITNNKLKCHDQSFFKMASFYREIWVCELFLIKLFLKEA